MEPQVLHFIVCDDVLVDTHNFHRVHIRGMRVRLRLRGELPVRVDFSFLAILVGFRGSGDLKIRILEEATGRRIAESRNYPVSFPRNTSEVVSIVFRMKQCTLPQLGLYRVELLKGQVVLRQAPFWLLPQE